MDSSRDQRIATLAATLKSSGIARSEAQAKMMAEDMIGVEDKVQKRSEEVHAQANEHISTSKHLGDSRVTKAPEPVEAPKKTESQPIRNIPTIPTSSNSAHAGQSSILSALNMDSVTSENNFGKSNDSKPSDGSIDARGIRSSNDSAQFGTTSGRSSSTSNSHDTHNYLIESIKAQVSKEHIVPLYDQYMAKIGEPVVSRTSEEIKPSHESRAEEVKFDDVKINDVKFDSISDSHNDLHGEEHVLLESVKIEVYDVEPAKIESNTNGSTNNDLNNTESNNSVSDSVQIELVEEIQVTLEDKTLLEEPLPPKINSVEQELSNQESKSNENVSEESEAPKLDGAKLAELMAEDGPMEEHTRQLPPKPEVVKPKESFVEDTIDLASVFKFKR